MRSEESRADLRPAAGRGSGATERPRLLLAEDDDYMRDLVAQTLNRAGFEVIEACSAAELRQKLETLVLRSTDGRPVDLIVSDVRMPWGSGLTVLAGLRRSDWATPLIVITAFGDEATHAEARRLGAVAVFDKPFDLYRLRETALRCVGASAMA